MNFYINNINYDMQEAKKHTAILGGTGSGKTTLALDLIEQLLIQDVPVIMIDRKGDLANYANHLSYTCELNNEHLKQRQHYFRNSIKVNLFTPGHIDGRSLAIDMLPTYLGDLNSFEKNKLIRQVASSLGSMMNYKTRSELNRVSLLTKVIEDLAYEEELTLEVLIDRITYPSEKLFKETIAFPVSAFKKLAEDLQVLYFNSSNLIEGKEKIDIDYMFDNEDKTSLSIISTKFLESEENTLFWITQLLHSLEVWISKNPSDKLRGVLMLDEADMYLPAMRNPSTKKPLENLLKRARSAGVGIMLVTQNPGDLDYRCRENIGTWFIGSIKESNGIDKIKPMFGNNISKLKEVPTLNLGEFKFIQKGKVISFNANLNMIKTSQMSEDNILDVAYGVKENGIKIDEDVEYLNKKVE